MTYRRQMVASLHELTCRECRGPWLSWAVRLVVGDRPPRCTTCGESIRTPGCCVTPEGTASHTLHGGREWSK